PPWRSPSSPPGRLPTVRYRNSLAATLSLRLGYQSWPASMPRWLSISAARRSHSLLSTGRIPDPRTAQEAVRRYLPLAEGAQVGPYDPRLKRVGRPTRPCPGLPYPGG